MRIDKALEGFGLLTKGIIQTTENKTKEQRFEFLGPLLRTLSAFLLGKMFSGKCVIIAGDGVRTAGQNF